MDALKHINSGKKKQKIQRGQQETMKGNWIFDIKKKERLNFETLNK